MAPEVFLDSLVSRIPYFNTKWGGVNWVLPRYRLTVISVATFANIFAC